MLSRVVATATVTRKAASTVKVQRRHYGLGGMHSYFSSYIPPTGVLEKQELPDQTPFDKDHRPRRIRGQLMSRLSKMINETDFYTLTRVGKKEIRPPRPVDVPEPRNGMTVEKFLNTIGRGCENYAEKFEGNWEKLFSSRTHDLRAMEIPLKQRKWIFLWTERYRNGIDPWYIPLHSRTKRNNKLEWRWKLITQKERRAELGLD
eukprot:TRINITY_DN3448_c0_g1_i1.p1 TRINITY_DN3448_c0_g1~~TRINITY_DN3448_c0_g1_i1.p1  ORF type:complete len:204 (+),score=37.87 TRINITY_DN3448_c0_g1_i1:112-723(+)